MDCIMSMMTSQDLEDHLWMLSLKTPNVEKLDVSTIREFYDQYKKSCDTTLCCDLFCVLGYTEKYDYMRIGWFPVLLSLDMLYPQIISHCIDDDMMTFDYESVFRSSCVGLVLWAVRLVPFENWRYSKVYTTFFTVLLLRTQMLQMTTYSYIKNTQEIQRATNYFVHYYKKNTRKK